MATLELTEVQANYLIQALDLVVKTKGLQEAQNCLAMQQLISKAFEAKQETEE
ncbi:MAG: hypothetical protein Unbinned8472contig1000_90 [Prokaryotic dsDNA virus sp.]|nr:MAG: hypothetical protein Unbinned8472contig1000_90 [Prokaryotic dsDNA virus sp.]|tara:strand:+ start:30551 stop:30709 length:159 start_codon:yes stop_codon:yes gene_type:complete